MIVEILDIPTSSCSPSIAKNCLTIVWYHSRANLSSKIDMYSELQSVYYSIDTVIVTINTQLTMSHPTTEHVL